MATTLTTENLFNGDGSNKDFVITFPYLQEADVKVEHPIGTNVTAFSFLNATTIRITTAPASGTNNVKIYRDTNVDAAKAVFATGSSIRATDLNNNAEQTLFAGQEKVYTNDLSDAVVTSAKLSDNIDIRGTLDVTGVSTLTGNVSVGGTVDGRDIAADGTKLDGIETAATADQTAAEIRTLVESASNSNVFTDADHSKLNAIEAGATADQSNAEIRAAVEAASDSNVFTDADHSKLNAIEASATADQTASEIRALVESASDSNVFTDADHSKLNAIEASATADQTDAEIKTAYENNSNTNAYTDAEKSKLSGIETSATADQTDAEIRAAVEAASDSNVFTDADHTKLNAIEANATADQTAAEIKTAYESNSNTNAFTDTQNTFVNAITSSAAELNILDGVTSTTAELNILDGVTATTAELNLLDGVTATTTELNMLDNCTAVGTELSVLDGITANTSELNVLAGMTSNTTELNMLDGKQINNSINSNASHGGIPTSQAVREHVLAITQAAGGFYPIADDQSFPNANPDPNDDAGTVVSIADAGGLVVNGSGVTTTGRTLGGSTVTINGIDSSLHNSTIAAGKGMLVQTTSTLNTYDYHRLVVDEAGVATAQTLVSDFNERYRVGSTNPTSSLDDGDLFFNTTSDKMLVYNATDSSWDEVQSVGNFFINTLSSTGSGSDTPPGGSATFNGTAQKFGLNNAGASAFQHIVSVNGVIQKPNSGSSVPSEGFAIDGSTIIFSTAPASGSDYFIVTIGASVNIGTPSNNSVTSAMIVDGTIANGDISSSAAIAGSKLADDSIAEVKLDIHQAPSDGKFLKYTSSNGMEWGDVPAGVGGSAGVQFNDTVKATFGTTGSGDLQIYHDGSNSYIHDGGTGQLRVSSDNFKVYNQAQSETIINAVENGAVSLYYDNSKKFETYTGGAIVTGTLNIPDGSSSDNRITLGAGGDLKLYHDATNSIIDNDTGDLIVRCDSDDVKILAEDDILLRDNDDSTNFIHCINGGAVELFHNGTKRFETTSTGASMDGLLNFNNAGGKILLADSGKIQLGGGPDLEIYHDGSNSYITETSGSTPGDLRIQANNLKLSNWDGGGTYIYASNGGSVDLYHDNNKKFETTATGAAITGSLDFPDGNEARFGTGIDLKIRHDGTDNHIASANGDININVADTETAAVFKPNASVELYYDNVKKFQTVSSGSEVKGHLYFEDNNEIKLGDSGDLQIYHDGSHSRIHNSTGALIHRTASYYHWYNTDASETLAQFNVDGSCDLYYDGTKCFWTKSGASIATAGHLYIEDDKKVFFGNSSDLEIYHNGSNSKINNTTGTLYIQGDVVSIAGGNGSENLAVFTKDADCALYNDNSRVFNTQPGGVSVYGLEGGNCHLYLYADEGDDAADKWLQLAYAGSSEWQLRNLSNGSTWETSIQAVGAGKTSLYYDNTEKLKTQSWGIDIDGSLHFDDGSPTTSGITLGNANDMQIYHNGTDSFIYNATGNFNIRSDALYLKNKDDDETYIKCVNDGAVEIYHDNVKKFETVSDGVKITAAEGGESILYIHADEADDNADQYRIRVPNNDGFHIEAGSGNETAIKLDVNAGVQLYYDNVKKLETTSEGFESLGELHFKAPASTTGEQVGRIEWWNENDYGVMAKISVDRTASTNAPGALVFSTSDNVDTSSNGGDGNISERGRITPTGEFLWARTDYNIDSSNFGFLIWQAGSMYNSRNVNGSDGVAAHYGNAGECRFLGDGDVQNTNNSYGQISDETLKQDIVDAGSQWDDIKNVKVRKFRFKDKPTAPLQIGVVAQEIETVSPGLVKEVSQKDTRDDEPDAPKVKAVKYSVLYMKAIKALQEAMAKIETLETKVAALEAK